MAAPMSSESEKSDSDAIPDYLDPTSASFDPLKALYSAVDPFPHIASTQFNNLAQFQNFIEGKDAQTLKAKEKAQNKNDQQGKTSGLVKLRAHAQATEQARKAAITAKYAGPAERSNTQAKRKNMRTVFTAMQGFQKGPLNVLRLCVNDKLRVTVVIRAAVAVRSRCRGYVVAFDKHFNMALMDVDETYIRPAPKKKGMSKKGAQPGVTSSIDRDSDRMKSKNGDRSLACAIREKRDSESTDKRESDFRRNIDRNEGISGKRSSPDDRKEMASKETRERQRSSRKHYDSEVVSKGHRTSSDSRCVGTSKGHRTSSDNRCVGTRKGDSSDSDYRKDRSDSESRKDHKSSSGGRMDNGRNAYRSSSDYSRDGDRRETNQRSALYDKRGKEYDHRKKECDSRGREYVTRGKEYDKQERRLTDDKLDASTGSISSRIGMIDLREKLKKSHLQDSGSRQCMSDSEGEPSSSRSDRHSMSDSESGKQKKVECSESSSEKPEKCSDLFWRRYKKWTEERCYSDYEVVERHVNQLFIRGDNVVSVSIEDF